MASLESDGEVSGEVDPSNMQTIDNGNEDLATTVDPDNADASELATSVNQGDEEWNFSQKSWREDMELVVERKTLHVASNILSLLSPVFTSMFEERFQGDGPRRIELTGKKQDDVVQFLRCLYPNIYQQITEDSVFNVLPLADEFKIKELKKRCEDFLVEATNAQTSSENICKYMQLSSRHDLKVLNAKCVQLAACLDPKSLSAAEKVHPLPLDAKVEVQATQLDQLRKSMSKLHMDKQMKEGDCDLFRDYLKYDWVVTKGKTSLRQAETGALKLNVSGAKTFKSDKSRRSTVQGIQWYIEAIRHKNKEKGDCLGVFLCCMAPDWYAWECEVEAKVWLANKETGTHLAYDLANTFSSQGKAYGFNPFITFKDLTSGKKYVVDDAFDINIYMMAKQPTCKPDPKDLKKTDKTD